MQNIKIQLQQELESYLDDTGEFLPYYDGMNILTSALYKEQLKMILEKDGIADAKGFSLYLDTIIINMHTKAKKYKQSIYFDDDNIKDIENQGYTIVFYRDKKMNVFVLLGIVRAQLPQN